MLKYDEAEAYIHSLTRFGSQLGLERMVELLHRMGDPHKKQRFIHIAGTNGKGSTANMCAKVLTEAGYITGLYTSPFVNDFKERFQIDGKLIREKEFAEITTVVKAHIEDMKAELDMQITEFEAVTAIAFEYFYQRKCNFVCLEVGLGGKFDATNVIETPEIVIITSISLDHVAILGDTIEKIAGEKAGIIKEKCVVVTYPCQDEKALKVISDKCDSTNSILILPIKEVITDIKNVKTTVFEGTQFRYNGWKYRTLTGKHQAYNAVCVVEAMRALRTMGYNVSESLVKLGIEKTTVPARFERVPISAKPVLYIDGAHNIQSITSLAEHLPSLDKEVVIIMGMMADKDYEHSIKCITSVCKAFIAVDVNNPRAEKRDILAETASKYCNNVYSIGDYYQAVVKAVELAGEDGAVVVCGSFYLAGDMNRAARSFYKERIKQQKEATAN